jgi:predicted ATPase
MISNQYVSSVELLRDRVDSFERYPFNLVLDEPEAALSPCRQLAVLSRIHDLVDPERMLRVLMER